MTLSPGQWAPWISDPDPPGKLMTDEEAKAAAQKVAEFMRLHPTKASTPPKTSGGTSSQ